MKWAEKVSVSLRVMLILILVLVALAGTGAALLMRTYSQQVNEEIVRFCQETAESNVERVERRLSNYSLAMEMIQLNQSIRQAVFRNGVSRYAMVGLSSSLEKQIADLTYYLYQNDEIYSHYLYTHLPGDGGFFRDLSLSRSQKWYPAAMKNARVCVYDKSRVTNSYLLTLIQRTASPDGPPGDYCFQSLTVDTRDLFRRDSAESSPGLYVFDDSTGQAVFASGDDFAAADGYYREYLSDPASFSLPRSRGIPIFHRFDSINSTALYLFPPSPIQGYGMDLSMLVTSAAVLTIFIALLMLFGFYWIFTRRMDTLISKMDRFDETGVSPVYPLGGRDEIARVDRHLSKMQNRILYLIQEEYIAKMRNMEAQHEALIACVNPHFLFNTLNTISSMANLEGADDTVRMVEALGDMFRYSSAVNEKTVTLARELDNISDYLYIQQVRHPKGFACEIDVPEPLKECTVPKLILQPLVENAFKHGFTGRHGFTSPDGGTRLLRLRAWAEGPILSIEIRDNGCGMTPERLAAVRRTLDSPGGPPENGRTGIGLQNVNRRIRLLYGPACGLDIDSEAERYTCITVRTRIRGEEDIENGKNFNC